MNRQDERSAPLWLVILCAAGLGLWLKLVAGGPSVPSLPADWVSLESALRSSSPPMDGALVVARDLGWAAFGWLVVSLGLQTVAALAERVAATDRRVRQFRTVCDWLSLPLVRTAVHAALASGVVVQVAATSLSVVSAAGLDRPAAVQTVRRQPDVGAAAVSEVVYVVRPGDSLARIARQFYGDATKWQPIYRANVNRVMPDGDVFTRAGVLQPGWTLTIPGVEPPVHIDASGRTIYRVQPGDTLWNISKTELGSGERYPEIFERNVGARVDEVHVLRNPNLIWPDLDLDLGELGQPAAEVAQPAAPEAPSRPQTANVAEAAPQEGDESSVTASAAVQEPVRAADGDSEVEAVSESSPPPAVAAASPESERAGVPVLPIGLGTVAVLGVGAGAVAVRRRRTGVTPLAGRRARHGLVAWQPDALPGERRLARVFADVMQHQPAHLVAGYAAATSGALVFDIDSDCADALAAAAQSLDATTVEAGRDRVRWDLPKWPRRSAMGGDEASVLPLGLSPEQRVLYAPWPKSGHLLLAGEEGAGVRSALEALVADMALRLPPDQLGLYFVGEGLSATLARLPQARGPIISSDDERTVETLVRGLLEYSKRPGERVDTLVVEEWADVAGLAGMLLDPEQEGRGLRVVAATTRLDESTAELVRQFYNRLVFHVPDEPTSLALLGDPGAELLDRVGQCYPLIGGQPLPPVRAFRIAPEQLESLCGGEPGPGWSTPTHAPRDAGAPTVVDNDAAPGRASSPQATVGADDEDTVSQLPMGGMLVAVPSKRRATEPVTAPLTCRLLGAFEVLLNGETLPMPTGWAPAWELFCLVCSLPPGEATFARVSDLLSTASRSGDRLHYVEAQLSNLRRKVLRQWLTDEQVRRVVRVEGKVCLLEPTLVSSDVHEFLRLAAEGEASRESAMAVLACRQALEAYEGPLLGNADPYPWVAELRRSYVERAGAVRARLAALDGVAREAVSRVA